MGCLVLGASQASALPIVQIGTAPGFQRVQARMPGTQPGSEQQPQENQQARFAELNELLEATRAKLNELSNATAVAAEQRKEIEALKHDAERLADELGQANTRRTELERASKVAEGRIAELSKAIEVAVAETVRIGEELASVRREKSDLEQSLARAETARKAAEAKAGETPGIQAKLEAATAAAEQSKRELAELRKELERTGEQLAKAEKERQQVAARASEMEQAVERSGAEAERLKTDLAQVKEQLSQAASAAVEAERARQAASREADQFQGEAEQVREELAAAKSEVERFRTANAELEKQVASLSADSESAMEAARQNLVVMEQKFEQLHTALAGAGLVQPRRSAGAQAKPEPVADEASAGSNPPARTAQQAPPGPAESETPEQKSDGPARLAAIGPASAPSQEQGAGLERFDANVRYLNSRALEAAGANLFSGIEAAGNGVVHVSTTPAWQSIPPAGQRSYLNSLFDLWAVTQEGDGPAVVRIVDASGRVLLEKSGVAQDGAD
jgi:hypothetical protein